MVKRLSILSRGLNSILPLMLVSGFVLVAAFASTIAPPADPQNPLPFKLVESKELMPLPPSGETPLGTAVFHQGITLLHYDVFHSLIWGTRDALRFGMLVAFSAALLGILIGSISAYAGGLVNRITLRLTDAFLAFPLIAGVWLFKEIADTTLQLSQYAGIYYPNLDAVVAPLPERIRWINAIGLSPVAIAFILFSWMPYTRLINARILQIKQKDYILAARTTGVRHLGIIFKHLLPNAAAPALVLLARDIGGLVILQAAFDFIGIGGSITEGIAEWSRILYLGRTWIIGIGGNFLLYWWVYLPVTLALILFGVSWNWLGDKLNQTINPWLNT